jgi:intraflagellar transport protein 172
VYAHEIQKVDVYQERFIVARTQATLMLGDLDSCKLSEIPWESDQTERFFFDSEKV